MNDTSIHITDTIQPVSAGLGSWIDSIQDSNITIIRDTIVDSVAVANEVQAAAESAEGMAALSLMFKVMLILIAGVAVWRVMIIFNKKNAKPKGGHYFTRKYSDKWKNRSL